MGLHFLCSRTEVIRALWFDTGRAVLIIGPPRDFIEWMERVLPAGSCQVGDIGDVLPQLRDGAFKVVLVWVGDREDGPGTLRVALRELSNGSDLWAVMNRGEGPGEDLFALGASQELHRNRRLGLTPKCDLVPLVIRPKE